MKLVNITAEAQAAVRSASDAPGGFRETATRLPDGTYDVPLSDEVFERVTAAQFQGESFSDALVRIVALARRGGAN